jgi:hypothetical protein
VISRGEPGGLDPSFGAAAGAVVAFGHEQLGEEGAEGHLLADSGQPAAPEPAADQPEVTACRQRPTR